MLGLSMEKCDCIATAVSMHFEKHTFCGRLLHPLAAANI